jgi:hypothetical protein
MAGRGGGGDAVFPRHEQTPRRRRREPPTPPLSESALHQHQQYYQQQTYGYQYPLQSPGYQSQVSFGQGHSDASLADDAAATPLTAATTNFELTDYEAEWEASPGPESTPTEPGVTRKKQKRNKPTLSCFECVERKTKVRIRDMMGVALRVYGIDGPGVSQQGKI